MIFFASMINGAIFWILNTDTMKCAMKCAQNETRGHLHDSNDEKLEHKCVGVGGNDVANIYMESVRFWSVALKLRQQGHQVRRSRTFAEIKMIN